MTRIWKRIAAGALAAGVSLCLWGCRKEKEPFVPIETTEGGAILPEINQPSIEEVRYTPVYASSFGDTVILATVPIMDWHGTEADCEPREISNGGRIRCNGTHEDEVHITKVLVLEDVIPRVCSGWFRDMIHLEKVEGASRIRTHAVKDMSHMFAGCEKLTEIDWDGWDVSALEDTTGIFDGCYALESLPDWYEQ